MQNTTRIIRPLVSPSPGTPGEGWGEGLSRAFTLVEMLTVLAIIGVVLAVLIPTWNTLTNNNGISAAQTEVATVLGNARADAIYNRVPTGIFFYPDPVSGRVALAEVQVVGTYTYTPTGGAEQTVNLLDMVYNVTATGQANFYRDVQLLTRGVGVALNSNYGYNGVSPYIGAQPTNAANNPALDRYIRVGVVMFGPDGTLTSIPYAVAWQYSNAVTPPATPGANFNNGLDRPTGFGDGSPGPLSQAMQLSTLAGSLVAIPPTPPSPSPYINYQLTSQVGLLLYDQELYINHSDTDPATSTSFTFNMADLTYLPPPPNQGQTTSFSKKYVEENWLDQNGLALLISPFNGDLKALGTK